MFSYYWYYHGMVPEAEREDIKEAILGHDYEKFTKYAEKYNKIGEKRSWGKNSFFPDSIWDNKKDKYVPLNVKTFSKITYTEYENG